MNEDTGWAAGRGKRVIALLDADHHRIGAPDLMTLLLTDVVVSVEEMIEVLAP